jgi:pectinesterase
MKLLLALIALPVFGAIHVVVSQDGKGDFTTIQQAIDHAPLYGNDRLIIDIRPGTYHERVMVPQDKPRVTFQGQDAAKTIITYSMSATAARGTFFSSIVHIEANEFEAENVTFENSYAVGSQAVAISVRLSQVPVSGLAAYSLRQSGPSVLQRLLHRPARRFHLWQCLGCV